MSVMEGFLALLNLIFWFLLIELLASAYSLPISIVFPFTGDTACGRSNPSDLSASFLLTFVLGLFRSPRSLLYGR